MIPAVSALLYFLKDLLKAGCTLAIGSAVFGLEKRRRIALSALFTFLLAGAAALPALPTGLSEENTRMLADTASFFLCVALPLSAFRGVRGALRRFFCTVLVLDFTADALYSLIAEIGNDAVWFEAAFGIVLYGALLAFFAFAGRTRDLSFLRGAFQTIPRWTWAVLLFLEFTCYYRTFGEELSWYKVFSAVSAASVVAALLYLIYKLLRFSEQQTAVLRQLEQQREYGERLLRSDEELRSFRHDYRNHMIVVRAYLENGDAAAADAYLSGVSGLASEALRRVSTGNFAADAIVGYKLRAAEEAGVRLVFEGKIPAVGIRDEDLCTILANLLDNAIEACAPLPGEKTVLIEAVVNNGWLVLGVSNPSPASAAPAADGLPATTKADRKHHGFGLKNVRRAAQKYGGALTVSAKDGRFTADVRIRL